MADKDYPINPSGLTSANANSELLDDKRFRMVRNVSILPSCWTLAKSFQGTPSVFNIRRYCTRGEPLARILSFNSFRLCVKFYYIFQNCLFSGWCVIAVCFSFQCKCLVKSSINCKRMWTHLLQRCVMRIVIYDYFESEIIQAQLIKQ